MNTRDVIPKLGKKRVQDYSFTILFFVIFSVFVIGAIQPNVLTVFRLQKELEDLKVTNDQYEQLITNIVDNQAILEENRDNFYLLDEAIPQKLQLTKLLDDIRNSASSSGVVMEAIDVKEIDLKEPIPPKAGVKNFVISFDTTSTREDTKKFIDAMINQRRLKAINSVDIAPATSEDASESSTLRVGMEVEGYYNL